MMNPMTMEHFAYELYSCAHEPATVVQKIATATLYKQATEFKGARTCDSQHYQNYLFNQH